ncbi:MAG: LptA/OstA family protein [Desulfobacterales bacterium]
MTKTEDIIPQQRPANRLSAAGLCLVCLVLFFAAPAQSAGMFAPGGGEIHITAQRMVMQSDRNMAEFIGEVHATQADTTVRSESLKVFYESGADSDMQEGGVNQEAIRRVIATGSVIIDFQDSTAYCEKAVYTAKDGMLVLTGDTARLEGRDSVITGREITLNRNTGEVVVSGDKNGRVEAVFQSDSEPDGDTGSRDRSNGAQK